MLCKIRRYWQCRINKRVVVEVYMFLISYVAGVWWASQFTVTCPGNRRDFFRYNHHGPRHLKYGESFSKNPHNSTSDQYSLLTRYKHVCNLYGLKIKLTHLPDIYDDCEWLVWFPESAYQHPSMFGAILNQLDYNMPMVITANGLNYKIKRRNDIRDLRVMVSNDIIVSGEMMAISLGLLYKLSEMGEYTAVFPSSENLLLSSLHESFGKSHLLYWSDVGAGFENEKSQYQNMSPTFQMAEQSITKSLISIRQNTLEGRIKQLIQRSASLNQEILTMTSIQNLKRIYRVKKTKKPLLISLHGTGQHGLECTKRRRYPWPTHISWRPDRPAFNFVSLSDSWTCLNHGKSYSLCGLAKIRSITHLQSGSLRSAIESSGLMEYGTKILNTEKILFYNAYQRVDPIYGSYFSLILRGRTSKRKKYRHLPVLLAVPFGVPLMKDESLVLTPSPKNGVSWLPYYLQPTNMLNKLMPTETSKQYTPQTYKSNDRLVFIIPLYGRYQATLTFMDNYEKTILYSKNWKRLNVVLLVVLFDDSLADNPQAINIATLLQAYRDRHGYEAIEIMYTHHTTFSRGRGLDLGIKKLLSNDIAFFVDVDMVISAAMVTTCRRNVLKGYNIWFPVAFSQYNPKNKCNHVDKGNKTYKDEDIGFWRMYGYGMACLYKADYLMAGGFDLSIRGWGNEDVDLCRSAIKHNLQIFRSNLFGLTHIYHDKHCDRTLEEEKLKSCESTKFLHFASKRCLAQYYQQQIKGS